MITVRLPSTLRAGGGTVLQIDEPVASIADLIDVLDRRIPGLKAQLDDAIFNFAVNDEMLLHGTRDRALASGDVVEIVPAISGGSGRGIGRDRADASSANLANSFAKPIACGLRLT